MLVKCSSRPFEDSPVNDTIGKACPQFTWWGQLTTGQIREELKQSKEWLEDRIQCKIYTLIYPYGKFNKQVEAIAKEQGYAYALTVNAQTKETLDFTNPYELTRYRVNGQQDTHPEGFFADKR
jgi:peptidoglycan/xylan/chitin deacetylase (PgdA/CDA1 family)